MKATKWVTRLHRIDKKLLPPTIVGKGNVQSCYYTIRTPHKGLYQIGLYTDDGWDTLSYITIFDPAKKRLRVINVGRKRIKYETVQRYRDLIKQQGVSKAIQTILKKANLSESFLMLEDWSSKFTKLTTSLQVILAIALNLFTLILLALFLAKWARNVAIEQSVNRIEQSVNKELYKYQTGQEKEFEVYADLINQVKRLVESKSIHGMIIAGPPGTGKTYVVRRTLYFNHIPHKVLKGTSLNVWSLYAELFKQRKGLLLLDDFDIPWTEELIGLLKAATDTQPRRPLYFPATSVTTSSQEGEVSEVPNSFVYEGKLIIITNKDVDKIPLPLKSRMPTIEVKFDAKQMLKIVESMLKFIRPDVPMEQKKKVFDFLVSLYKQNKLKRIDFRSVILAIDLSIAYPDSWQKMVVRYLT